MPELKSEAFAIPELSWCCASSMSYSSLAHSQLAVAGEASDVNPFPEKLPHCQLRAGCPAFIVNELGLARTWSSRAFKAGVAVKSGDFFGQ